MEPALASDETELLRRARAGDRSAFGELLRRHQRSVFFLALRMGRGDEQLARDIVQKTFLRAWRGRDSFRGDASVKTWLLRIATNLTLNELRRAYRRREFVPEVESDEEPPPLGHVDASAFEALAHTEARALLREAVDTLSPRQKSVALLRIYDDLSFQEVADVVGITPNNAKVNFHHAVKKIRRYLSDKGVAA